MTDVITDSAGLSGPVSESSRPRKRTAASTTATKKAAKEAPVEIKNVELSSEENDLINKDGQTVIKTPKRQQTSKKSNSFTKENGAISSGAADFSLENKNNTESTNEDSELDNVALWSEKNIRWGGVGSLTRGYNIVKKEDAEKWLTLGAIREATPEEISTYFGN